MTSAQDHGEAIAQPRRLRLAGTEAPAATVDRGPSPSPVEAPAEFFRRYAPYVARVAIRLEANDDELEDVVHDVFLSAFRQAERLRDPEAARGWLATMTVRIVRRRARRRRLRRLIGLGEAPPIHVEAPGASPEQRMQIREVYRLLDDIAVEDAIAWKLRYVEGARLQEVAERCECSLATAKRRIARAAAHLEVHLGDPDEARDQALGEGEGGRG